MKQRKKLDYSRYNGGNHTYIFLLKKPKYGFCLINPFRTPYLHCEYIGIYYYTCGVVGRCDLP